MFFYENIMIEVLILELTSRNHLLTQWIYDTKSS